MKKFLTWDKALHFIYTYALQLTLLLIFGVWSLVASLIFPVVKESLDYKEYGKFDMTDLMVGIVGGVFAAFVYYIL